MPIQFNVKNNAGATVTQSLNTSRVERILQANNLNEAQRMGMFDKIKDFFRGGVKAEAIRQLFDQVTAPAPHAAQPLNILHRFESLRALASNEHQHLFSSNVQVGESQAQGTWSFSLSVGDTPIYQSSTLDEVPESSSTQFLQAQQLHQGINDSIAEFRKAANDGNPDSSEKVELHVTAQGAIDAIKTLMGAEHENPDAKQMFEFVRNLQPANNPYLQKLAAEKHEGASLLQLCFPEHEEAKNLDLFDEAKSQLTEAVFNQLPSYVQQAEHTAASLWERTPMQYALENVQDVVETKAERAALIQKIEDPLYSRQNFRGIEVVEDGKYFNAIFQQGDEPPQTIAFSNREPENSEFRGSPVKHLLANAEYTNLLGLLSHGMKGRDDPLVKSAGGFVAIQLLRHLELQNTHNLSPFLRYLQWQGPQDVADKTFDALRSVKLAETNLLALWMRDSAPDSPAATGLIRSGGYA